MMKSTKRLAIKKETIRQLDGLELEHARGAIGRTMTVCGGCSVNFYCVHTKDDTSCGQSEGVRCPTHLNGCPIGR